MEVLISVAVLSLILTTTFALANRNTQANRQAAERAEAFKIAQSQMEKLKLYLSTGADLPPEGEYFCMTDSALNPMKELGDDAPNPNNPNEDINFEDGVYANIGSDCGPADDLYYPIILRGGAGSPLAGIDKNTYIAYVRWNAVTGNGVDQSSMVHRLYPDGVL